MPPEMPQNEFFTIVNKTNAYQYSSFRSLFHLTRLHATFRFHSILSFVLSTLSVTNLSDYDGCDLSFMDDDDIDEITYTNSNHLIRRSLTGTSITSISEDRRSVSTLNQQNFEEIVKDDEGVFQFKEPLFV